MICLQSVMVIPNPSALLHPIKETLGKQIIKMSFKKKNFFFYKIVLLGMMKIMMIAIRTT